MPSVRTQDVRSAVLQTAERELRSAAGNNGLLSRTEQATLDPFLGACAEDARVPGRALRVDAALARVVDVVDTELARVNTRGPAFLSVAETDAIGDPALKTRVWAARMALCALDDAALRAAAAGAVRAHAEPVAGVVTQKILPALDSGSHGLRGHFVDGAAATRLATVANTWNILDNNGTPKPPPLVGFDPAKTQLFVVETTQFDNEKLFVVGIDKTTGAASTPFMLDVGSVASRIPESTFVANVGPLSSFARAGLGRAPAYDYFDLDMKKIVTAMLTGARAVDIGNPLSAVASADVARVEGAVRAAVDAAGLPLATVISGGPGLVAQEKLPGTVISAAEAVRRGLDSFRTDATDPDSPLGMLIETVRQAAGEATPSQATLTEARRRLDAFLNSPDTRLRLLALDEEPEGGPPVRTRWALELVNDTMNATVHYAIVDRAGLAPTTNYGFT